MSRKDESRQRRREAISQVAAESNARDRAQAYDRDLLHIICAATGTKFREVRLPPSPTPPAVLDHAVVRHWPVEAYAGERYQIKAAP